MRLVGHSLGGNIVMHYAGVRPARVDRVVSLEGFGIPAEAADDAPRKIAKWLDAIATRRVSSPTTDLAAVADRLQKKNPRLPRDKAEFLAPHWARALPDGRARAVFGSAPQDAVSACLSDRGIRRRMAQRHGARALGCGDRDPKIPRWLARHPEGDTGTDGLDEVRRRLAHVRNGRLVMIAEAAHMLHHDQPAAVAAQIEPFLAA